MTEYTVAKWGQSQAVAEAPCGGCGQPMLYNLAVGYVGHTDAAVDPCDEPWPDEPRPGYVKRIFAQVEADAAALRRAGPILDRLIEDMVAEVGSAFIPPKPFDLAALTKLATDVEAMRPKVDRAIIAADVRDWLLANVATRPAERLSPDHLWGTPVVVDEDMAPGSWELRDGDRVVRSSGQAP